MNCTNCGLEAPTSQQPDKLLDDGWSFNWLALGHYGGFTDCLPERDKNPNHDDYIAHLCHDCCVTLLLALPGLAGVIFPEGGGGHPNVNEHDSEDGTLTPPCCQWAWTWKRRPAADKNGEKYDTYFGTKEGGWRKAFDD